MNRVQAHIENLRAKTATIDADKLAALDKSMAVDSSEHFAFQEAQARAHAEGLLSPDEAQIVYLALGESGSDANGGWAEDTDVETKTTVTILIRELLSARIDGRKLRRAS